MRVWKPNCNHKNKTAEKHTVISKLRNLLTNSRCFHTLIDDFSFRGVPKKTEMHLPNEATTPEKNSVFYWHLFLHTKRTHSKRNISDDSILVWELHFQGGSHDSGHLALGLIKSLNHSQEKNAEKWSTSYQPLCIFGCIHGPRWGFEPDSKNCIKTRHLTIPNHN